MKKKKEKFYTEKNSTINGYTPIYDRDDIDEIIWIDCNEGYLKIIVDALNIRHKLIKYIL